MSQIGATRNIAAQSLTSTTDPQGNAIITPDTEFGSSPAGTALLTQQLFGLPNATFNLTPPDVYSAIGPDNKLPYWDFIEYSDGVMAGSAVYDSTTQTWAVELNPGTAASGDYCALTTRSYLINDDNLGLRQQVFSILSKSGTAGGTASQWNLTLSATYYSATDTALSTAFIGTVYDTGTWTSLSGTTTTGGSAISASARYVDLQYKLTATAAVTGSAKAKIKSTLLQSSTIASKSFIVTETFTSSTTWAVPTGVTSLLAVVAVGAGGGGASGGIAAIRQVGQIRVAGSGGGGGAPYLIVRDLPIGTASSISVGIGAGGAGGTAQTFTKAANNSANTATQGAAGAGGGATTFGSYFTVVGGGGGTAGQVNNNNLAATAGGGGTAGTFTSDYASATPGTPFTTATGGVGGSCTAATAPYFSEAGSPGGYGALALIYPYATAKLGVNGGTATTSGTATTFTAGAIGTALGSATFGGGGGGGGSLAGTVTVSASGGAGGAGTPYRGAAGGGGASVIACITGGGAGTVSATAGSGGAAPAYGGGGGGAGGGLGFSTTSTGNYDARPIAGTSGAGGKGSDGYLAIVYIG